MRLRDKLLCGLLLTLILALTLPLAASADDIGDFTVTGGVYGTNYTYASNTLTFTQSGTYEVSMKSGVTSTTADRIVVASGVTADITLNGVSIDLSGSDNTCAFDMTGATVNLTVTGDNTLKSGSGSAGLLCPKESALTIGGSGTLTATSGDYGAGIGGEAVYNESGSVTTHVIAESLPLTANSGTVTATGGSNCAGIGGGGFGDGGTVSISAGTVVATGGGTDPNSYSGAGAGIGGGDTGDGSTVYISGGSVKAIAGGENAEAIGIGAGGSNSGTLENNSTVMTSVYLTTVTLADAFDLPIGMASISSLTASLNSTAYLYGTTDMQTDTGGKLYLYLPENTLTTAAKTTSDYSGEVTTTTNPATSLGTLTLAGTAPTITTTSLPGGTVGKSYNQTLAADGDSPITWSIDSGNLPDGLGLSGDTISGTPTTEGTVGLTIKAENSAGNDTKALSIIVSRVTTYTITASAGSGGSISPSGTISVPEGGSQSFAITPNANYSIAYDPAKIAEGERPVIRHRDETTGEWVDLPTAVEQDADGKWYAVTHVSHLTKFAVFSAPAQEAAQKVVVLTLGRQAATVDGSPCTLDGVPFATEGRTMAPIRFVGEALDAQVGWNAGDRTITIRDDGKTVVLTLGSKNTLVNGETTAIDRAPAIMPPGRTFIPLRFVAETLGATIDYNATTRMITITR